MVFVYRAFILRSSIYVWPKSLIDPEEEGTNWPQMFFTSRASGHKAACVDMGWLCYGQVKGGYWGCNHNQGVTGSKGGYWGSKHNHLDPGPEPNVHHT